MEVWKDVVGYEGLYQVSNLGNVKSFKCGKERILKPVFNGAGYYQIGLYKNKETKIFRVHQLIAISFLGYVSDEAQKVVVDHIDNNPLNNKLDNLQVITKRENSSKDRKRDLPIGVSFHKLSNKYVAQIRIDCKKIHLGLYSTPEEASEVYQNKLIEINSNK
jgi:hypothetical protein